MQCVLSLLSVSIKYNRTLNSITVPNLLSQRHINHQLLGTEQINLQTFITLNQDAFSTFFWLFSNKILTQYYNFKVSRFYCNNVFFGQISYKPSILQNYTKFDRETANGIIVALSNFHYTN